MVCGSYPQDDCILLVSRLAAWELFRNALMVHQGRIRKEPNHSPNPHQYEELCYTFTRVVFLSIESIFLPFPVPLPSLLLSLHPPFFPSMKFLLNQKTVLYFFTYMWKQINSWKIKKAECQIINAFKLWCWRRLLRVPWTARRTN